MRRRGFIRFVGGSHHNRHLNLAAWNEIVVLLPIESELQYACGHVEGDCIPLRADAYERYVLVRLRTSMDTMFWEYHCRPRPRLIKKETTYGVSPLQPAIDFLQQERYAVDLKKINAVPLPLKPV